MKLNSLKEQFFKEFPETTKGEYACFADFSNGESCVWDEDKPEDCWQASKGIKKFDCKEWRRGDDEDNCYYPADVWNWILNNIS